MYNLPNSDDLLKKRLQDMMMAQQPNQLQTAPTATPQPDLLAERLRSAGPSPDAAPISPVAPARNYVSAPTPVPRAAEHVSFPSHVAAPPVDLAQERLAMSAAPQQQGVDPTSGIPSSTTQSPNAPYPFTPRPEYKDEHAQGQPIGLGQRILHSLKSAGMGFMRGGVGGAAAGAIGGAVDPNFYHRAQYYYKDLPLWQQRQQDEVEQAKTQQGLNESNARIGNIGADNDLARERLTQEKDRAARELEERVRNHKASEGEKSLNDYMTRFPGQPIPKELAEAAGHPYLAGHVPTAKAPPGEKAGDWDKIVDAQGKITYVNKLTGAKRAVEGITAHVPADPNAVTDTEDIFDYRGETPEAHSKRKQEAMTEIDSRIARGDLEPDEGSKMKLSWDNANPPPRPVKVGSRRAKTSGGGAAPSGGQQGADHTGYAIGQTVEHDGKKYTYKGINPQTGKMRLVPAE